MESTSEHPVRVEVSRSRGIAAVGASLRMADVPQRFAPYLEQVYAASRAGAVELDGQNIFVYHTDASPDAATEIEFGVGCAESFAPVGSVRYITVPSGEVAATTHWGDYAGLGAARSAVVRYCRTHALALAGPRWEVYGHWSDEPARRRTDVYYLLRRT
jgi:effector-binding domain-containing protein